MSLITSIKEVKVGMNFCGVINLVGRLAIRYRLIYFEYEPTFIKGRLKISPWFLLLESGVHSFDHNLFESLHGVFNENLPDDLGRAF